MILSKTPLRISFFGGGTDFPEYFNKNQTLFNQLTYLVIPSTNPSYALMNPSGSPMFASHPPSLLAAAAYHF